MSRDISNSDDVIDSRDVIERLEELQALRKPWTAGYNMPGYMPDAEPCTFETFEDAQEYIIEEMNRSAEHHSDEVATDLNHAAEDVNLWSEGEQGVTVANWHYWIARSENEGFEDASELEELKALEALASEAEDYSDDWQYGSTLIRDSYFTAYAQEMLEDCGDLPKGLPSYIEIDWEATARNIQADYTSVEFDGVTYWVR